LNKILTQDHLDHLLEFIGYGRLDADIWFIVMEEYGGSEENLQARLKFEQVDDFARVQQFPGARGMSEIMLRLDDETPDEAMLQNYQAERLGRPFGSTLLSVLMPIPKSDSSDWGYATSLPQYESQKACYETIKSERLELFRQMVEENHPKIVVGCGKEAWADYQELFNHLKFSPNDQFLVGWDMDTVVILTEQLDAPEMEGKFDPIVAIIRENALSIDTSIRPETPILSESELKRQKKAAARQAAVAKRKPSTTHDPADPYCVCAYCLKYEGSN
jgi:hypothetical protein